uniref:Helix-turn-helix domain-containing protein n=1 Tax=Heterorhabditis bacteriophora TaxID=37862 RepID=A0A1I7X3Z1_HETBA
MASISKLDYDDFEPAEKRATMGTLAVGYGAGLDTLRRTIQRNRAISLGNGSLKDRCIRPDDEVCQSHCNGCFPTKRELKQYLHDLATNLAS